jgi:polyhydroxybutyrate depolymerase
MNMMQKKHIILFLLPFLLIYGGCKSTASDEESVRATMKKWKQAIVAQDVDAIAACYSENFKSMDGNGREGARQMWTEIKELGMLEKIEINLENAKIEMKDEIAEFYIYNDEGEVEMDFALAKEDGKTWLITGIPSENCSYEKNYLSPYGDDCVQHDGYYRCWDIYIPPGLTNKSPLMIDLHGWQDKPSNQRSLSGFESLAGEEGFIVVWPYGLCNSWNSGKACCPPANEDEIDDVGFIRKMVKKISDQHSIDLNRIYVTGLSNGCSMTQRLANEASDMIAAAACMSLHLLVPKSPDYGPISVMTIMGTKDDLYYANEEMPGAKENFEKWKEMNNCAGTYEVTWSSGNSVAWTYRDCENNTEVTLVTIDGGGHSLYKGVDTEINTTHLAWDFMKRFKK